MGSVDTETTYQLMRYNGNIGLHFRKTKKEQFVCGMILRVYGAECYKPTGFAEAADWVTRNCDMKDSLPQI